MHVYHYCALVCAGEYSAQVDGLAEVTSPINNMVEYQRLRDMLNDRHWTVVPATGHGSRLVITSLTYMGCTDE